jgi:hypothetical protein
MQKVIHMDLSSLAARLSLICDLIYDSHAAAARDLEILSYNTLYRYLMGKGKPSSTTLERIAAIGVNLNWLLTGSGSVFSADAVGQALRATVIASLQSGAKPRDLCPPELDHMIDTGTTRTAGGPSDGSDISDQQHTAVDDHHGTPRGAAHPRVATRTRSNKG